MRLLACSDLHCDLDATARVVEAGRQADVVVVAGDIAIKGQGGLPVLRALRALSAPVILVPGNHDNLTEMRHYCHDWQGAHVLHGDGITLRGMPFFGLGGQVPPNAVEPLSFGLSEARAASMMRSCPEGAVLITHTPPKGHCDLQKDGKVDGSTAVLKQAQTVRPRLLLCGHIHASFGTTSRIGDCPIHNLGPTVNWFSL